MADGAEPDLLVLCPRCAYSLRGLPLRHQCPECGLPFDRRWLVFGGRTMPRESRTFTRSLILYVSLIMTVAMVVTLILPWQRPRHYQAWASTLVVGSAVALAAWTFFRTPRGFIALSPEGVAIYRCRDRWEHYAWSRLGQARHDLFRKHVLIDQTGSPPIVIDHHRFFGPHVLEADRFLRAFNQFSRPALDSQHRAGAS